ncbi:MAG: hypothetical protein ACRERD_21665 [Candidatus Binatia bacterium]
MKVLLDTNLYVLLLTPSPAREAAEGYLHRLDFQLYLCSVVAQRLLLCHGGKVIIARLTAGRPTARGGEKALKGFDTEALRDTEVLLEWFSHQFSLAIAIARCQGAKSLELRANLRRCQYPDLPFLPCLISMPIFPRAL